MSSFYTLAPSTKEILEANEWCAGFSGGKDSTSMVVWLEWLRRSGQIIVTKPRLVISDTEVEFPFLMEIAHELIEKLEKSEWVATRVGPKRKDKLYCKIFGSGTTPVNPASRRLMRWCTSSTKVSPIKRFRRTLGPDILGLSAVRFGESKIRDEKLQSVSCSAGGECGVQAASETENVFGPIINWKLCEIYDWLQGLVSKEVTRYIPDLLITMKKLVRVYDFRKEKTQIDLPMVEPDINSLRFGCIGCPAIANDKALNRAIIEREDWKYLKGIHHIWDQLRLPYNRCSRIKDGKVQYGPIKMEVRKKWFEELLKIQKQSGVIIVTEKDIEYIRKCWRLNKYPRGWSEADEKGVSVQEEGQIL